MTGNPILPHFLLLANHCLARWSNTHRPDFHTPWLYPDRPPRFVADCPVARRLLDLLGPLDWAHFPERNLQRNWGHLTTPHAAFSAAALIQLNEGLVSMGHLRRYLIEHPSLIWLCGFPPSSPS